MSRIRTIHITLSLGVATLSLGSCLQQGVVMSAPSSEYTQVSTGTQHACALSPLGSVLCWGATDGRPTLVSGALIFSSISTQTDHTCGVTERDNLAYCWGHNSFGQLGTQQPLALCRIFGSISAFPCSTRPVAVETSIEFTSLDVGRAHTCGLDAAGTAYCWGLDFRGELGAVTDSSCQSDLVAGGFACSAVPLPVDGGIVFTTLSVGASHTCGVSAAGEGYCWGVNDFGRLGDGTLDDRAQPTLVSGNIVFQTISAGGSHSCGVATDGMAYCWGSNSDFQLGSGDTDATLDCSAIPLRCVASPTAVSTSLRFASVTASDAVLFVGVGPEVGGHSCGLTTEGAVYCWGLNEFGELGLPNKLRWAEPVHIQAEESFTQISAGQMNTCGTTSGSNVVCWAFGSPLTRWTLPAQ